MSPLPRAIRQLRLFLMANHALSAFSRALLYSLLALCASAIGFKITLGEIPVWGVTLGLFLPVLFALPSLLRFPLESAAAHLDRTLRLDERLSTSLNVQGPFAEAQRRDAERELEKTDLSSVRRLHWPKELYFAGACSLVLGATLVAPMPVESQGLREVDPKDEAALAKAEVQVRSVNDEGLGSVRELKDRILKEIRRAKDKPERKEDALEAVNQAVGLAREKLMSSTLSDKERKAWEDLQQALDSAGGALSARVRGKPAERLFRPSPTTVDKISKAAGDTTHAGASENAPVSFHISGDEIPPGMTVNVYQEKIRRIYDDDRWDHKYAPIVEEFFGGTK